jgi:glycosyltransferase involved in cell wall biosynthesis
MLQVSNGTTLDRSRWHKPLVSVIVTHYNYSDYVRDALLSVLDQTHDNWECVVVDDGSALEHRAAVERIVDGIGSAKIRLVKQENGGQTWAAYTGLDHTSGEFVCILDPDDRYAETFIEDAVAGHLNETTYCPILSTDQFLVANGEVIAGTFTWQRHRLMHSEGSVNVVPERPQVRLLHIPAWVGGWHWGSTSSMMFRRPAMELMRPKARPYWKLDADCYLAQGAHLLGGTLFLTKSLVYRTVHSGNAYFINRVLTLATSHEGKFDGQEHGRMRRQDVMAAIKANGGEALMWKSEKRRHRGVLARWKRSFDRRWRQIRNRKAHQTGR